MSEDINVTDGTVLEALNNKVDLDGGNYKGSALEEYIHQHCGGGVNLFDTKLSDHILEGEEAQGWALQGTYVYKDAVAGSRDGYPDFYAKCLEEYQSELNVVSNIPYELPILSSNTSSTDITLSDPKLSGGSASGEGTIVFGTSAVTSFTDVYKGFDNNDTTYFQLNATKFGWTVFDITFDTPKYIHSLYAKGAVVSSTACALVAAKLYNINDDQEPELLGEQTTNNICSFEFVPVLTNKIRVCLQSDTDGSSYRTRLTTLNIGAYYVNIKQHPNGHLFYDIADKEVVDSFFNAIGSAWFYGVDTENERIFLPRNNYFEQATADGSEVGLSVEAGLPNIIGDLGSQAFGTWNGAFYDTGLKRSDSAHPEKQSSGNYAAFDASLSNPIYGNSDTVQPNAVKKLLYICVGNTTSTSAVTDVVEVTTTENDTLPLLHHIPADELLEHPSWLRSAGQWNDGKVYTTAYEYLVNEYVNGQAHTDTLTTPNGTEYTVNYKTIKGKKVVDVVNESQVNAVYNVIGSAWYYIIDQANIQFKLPQSHNSECYTSDPTRVGLDVSAGLPNITGSTVYPFDDNNNNYITGAFYSDDASSVVGATGGGKDRVANFDASLSNPIYGNSDTVTPPHTEFYLYFKVANAVQNLELLDVGAVTETLANKVDINSKVIDGQWVQNVVNLGTQTAKGTYLCDISTVLPNDGYDYEVMLNLRAYNSNSSNSGDVYIYSDIFTKLGTGVYDSQGTCGGNGRQVANTFILPVGTGRTIIYEIATYAVSNLSLNIWGYRRIGTNR